jgi:RNA methyltransferase, TrmH family
VIRQILSPSNQYIKLTASLQQKKYRDETGLFFVEGNRLVREAIDSSWPMEFALISETESIDAPTQRVLEALTAKDCPVMTVPESLYRKISDTESPQGLLAVLRQQAASLEEVAVNEKSSLWVILDAIQDPGNVGTIIRTADAAGATGVLLAADCADIYAGKTLRATMGSLFHIPVVKASRSECLSFCEKRFLNLYIAGAEAAADYTEVDFTLPSAVVFGNEGAGVSEFFRLQAVSAIRIPIKGSAESLNVASAAAVILFEAARQQECALS